MGFRHGILVAATLMATWLCTFAQPFTACITSAEFALTNWCTGGTPLPDGTPIYIFHDADSTGPDANDSLAAVCEMPPDCPTGPPGTDNYNTYPGGMNGALYIGAPGYFAFDPCFISVGILPPAPRYYLKIPVTASTAWVSRVMTMVPGPQEFWLVEGDWTWTGGYGTGVVTNANSHNPISGAKVWVDGGADTVVTNIQGRYCIFADSGSVLCFRHAYHCDTCAVTRDMAMLSAQCMPNVTSLSFVIHNGQDSSSQTFSITNQDGHCPLNFTLVDSAEWIHCIPESGSLDPGDQITITATVISDLAEPGMETILWIYSNATGTPRQVRVDILFVDSADPAGAAPTSTALHAAYPNPFNPATTLRFDLANPGAVTLTVFNSLGQTVATPVDDIMAAGNHSVAFDGSDLPSGVYFCRLSTASGYAATQKMLLLK